MSDFGSKTTAAMIRRFARVALCVAGILVTVALVVPGVSLAAGGPVVTAVNPSVVQGSAYSGSLGTLTEDCPPIIEVAQGRSADALTTCGQLDPTATISWGDGHTTTATLTPRCDPPVNEGRPDAEQASCLPTSPPCSTQNDANCEWTVSDDGDHVYALPGTYDGSWTWSDPDDADGVTGGTVDFTATVSTAAFSLSNVTINRTGNDASLSGTLTDADPNVHCYDFTATVDWGDGNTTQVAVSPPATPAPIACINPINEDRPAAQPQRAAASEATFDVVGDHTYATADDPSQDAQLTVTYDYTDPDGTEHSTHASVTVAHLPVATTGQATDDTPTGATLNGQVDPQNGTVTDCHFEYGTTTAYNGTAPCSPSTITGPTAVSATVTGLEGKTTYHYRLVVTTGVGTTDGQDASFVTETPPPPGAPEVSTDIATDIGQTSAGLQGFVNPVGGTLSDCHFDWGTTTGYGNSIPCQESPVSGSNSVGVGAELTGLSPGTTYHFRLAAANPGTATSDGADVTFTTLPDCNVVAKVDYLEATGCLSDAGGVYSSTPGTPVDVNGLTLTPDASAISLTIDTTTGQVRSNGPISITAKHSGGGTADFIYDGTIDWSVSKPPRFAQSEPITTLSLPTLSNGTTGQIDGLSLDGDLQLSFDSGFGADLVGDAWLPLPGWLIHGLGITGSITINTLPDVGLQDGSETIKEADWSLLGSIGVKNLVLSYDPVQDIWYGNAQLQLPTPNQVAIGASLAIQHGAFHSFSADVENINIPIAFGVFLQQIYVDVGIHPTTVGGSLGVSFGPEVDGNALVKVNGGFTYQAASGNQPELLQATGQLTVLWLKGLNAYFDYYNPGGFRFGAVFNPDDDAPIYFKASLQGAIDDGHFDIDGQATVTLKYVDLSAGAEVLVSDAGAVGCLHLSVLGFGWSPGAAYTWATHSWDLMGDSCSVGPWQTLPIGIGQGDNQGALNTAAGSSREVRLTTGSDLVQLNGAGGAPRVTLTGPNGVHVRVPAHSVKPYFVSGFQVLQDPHDKRTWIAVQRGGGIWKITPEPGSTPVTAVRAAKLLPTPTVTGHVTGTGAGRHTLTWRMTPLPNEKVVFWEKGSGVDRIIGSSTASDGVLGFTPVAGPGGRRTIEADITLDRRPRTDVTVAHFTATAPAKPAKPASLAIHASGRKLTVSWKTVANAHTYLVHVLVTKGDGATLIAQVTAPKHAVTLTDAAPIKAATVTVTPESVTGLPGRAATVTFPTQKTKAKGK